ncbi:MAG: 3'(2'),5'-bisphosphate nucleotidase CysQ [Kofleriaceae bacterium]
MFEAELETAIRAARAAGAIVAEHYAQGPGEVERKQDDSPVTGADRAANTAILDVIRAAFPQDAILSEETPDDHARLRSQRVWIVDPLDGTRDFVQRSGEFAVHVGLAVDGEAVVGAVHVPVQGALYAAAHGAGAWLEHQGARSRLAVSPTMTRADLRIGISRFHLSDRLRAALDAGEIANRVAIGASVKHMAVAAGALDAVINLSSGEFEWDTCAPEVVVREAGGAYTDGAGRPFRYNQADPAHPHGSIASNRACHATLVELVARHLP